MFIPDPFDLDDDGVLNFSEHALRDEYLIEDFDDDDWDDDDDD